MKSGRDARQQGFRTEGCGTGGMRNRMDTGQEGTRTVEMHDRRDAGQKGWMIGWRQDRRNTGKTGEIPDRRNTGQGRCTGKKSSRTGGTKKYCMYSYQLDLIVSFVWRFGRHVVSSILLLRKFVSFVLLL